MNDFAAEFAEIAEAKGQRKIMIFCVPCVLGKVDEALSTLGTGQGVVVFYGIAKPVRTPIRSDCLRANLMIIVTLILLAASLLLATLVASAHAEEPKPSEEKLAELAEEFSDPLTTLPQIFIQSAYTPKFYGTDAQANRLIARLIVPRMPRLHSLLPFGQLIRPTFSLVTVPTGTGRGTRTAFGDVQLFDLAVIPWPERESGLLMGVGPMFVFPTATARRRGKARGKLVLPSGRSTRATGNS
jgi:hypothetical protein